MKRGLSFLLLLISFASLQAQPPRKFYTKFGGYGDDVGYSVQEIYNQQYIIVGSTSSFGNGASDAYLLLIDSMGQSVWQRTFGGLAADVGKSVLINPKDSGFVFSGYTSSFGNGGYDVYVVRTDKHGNLNWQGAFGGADWDFGSDLTFSVDGNLIVCGNSYNSVFGKSEGYVLKIDINTGIKLWEKKYGGVEDDEFKKIRFTTDNKYTLAGNTKSYGDINNDFWFFKINDNGDSLSSVVLGQPNKAEYCYDFIEDFNNSLVFCGSKDTSTNNVGRNVSYVLKTSLNGTVIGDVKIVGAFTDNDRLLSIANAKSGTDYFFSRTVFYNAGFNGIEVQPLLFTNVFTFVNSTTYGALGEDHAFKVSSTKDDGFVMVGSTHGFGAFGEDVFLIKIEKSLTAATLVTDVDNNDSAFESNTPNIFYSEDKVYFENAKQDNLAYEILNSAGVVVASGKTREMTVEVNPNLVNDLYIFRVISNSDIKIKFIKD